MPAPTNISAATATDLGPLPNTIAQRVDFSGTTYTVWYHYVALVTGVIGVFAFGDLVTYRPQLKVFSGVALDPVPLDSGPILATNQPVQIPVTSGIDYFFKILPNGGNPSPANLSINGQVAPTDPALAGSIFVNDDTEEFPLAILSSTTGAVLQFVNPFPASEAGDVLNDGTIAVQDGATSNVSVFSSALAQTGAFGGGAYTSNILISTNKTTTFYIGTKGAGAVHASAKTMTPAGVFGSTIGPFASAGLTGMAPSPDETILYYTGNGGSLNAAIKRWDTAGNVGTTDLATGNGASYTSADLVVLTDASVLVLFFNVSAGTDTVVKRYNAAGALQNTYGFGTGNDSATAPRICRAIDDPTSFWIWMHKSDGFSTFKNIKVSDGSAITTLTALEFEDGVSQEAATATPTARFGHSQSCPFLILRAAVGPPAPPTTTTTYPIRRLRQTAHLSTEQLWLFFSKLQLDCEAGVGLTTGQGSDPQVMLSWSDDGGHTWSAEQWMSAGLIGEYKRRVIWRRLGRSRDRVWRIVVSDPVAWRLLAAYIDVKKGTS